MNHSLTLNEYFPTELNHVTDIASRSPVTQSSLIFGTPNNQILVKQHHILDIDIVNHPVIIIQQYVSDIDIWTIDCLVKRILDEGYMTRIRYESYMTMYHVDLRFPIFIPRITNNFTNHWDLIFKWSMKGRRGFGHSSNSMCLVLRRRWYTNVPTSWWSEGAI